MALSRRIGHTRPSTATVPAAPRRLEATVRRRMMKSKIHRARVTDAHLDYVGSVSLDPELMALADILVGEQVQILDIDNGARFETYAIEGRPGECCLNGAAARLVHPGDKVIVITYADYDQSEVDNYAPKVVHVDDLNRPIDEGGLASLRLATPLPRRGSTVAL